MKAIVQDRYGSAEVLEAREIDKPEIGDDEVLVRVHAASVHVGDWILMTGSPFVMRLATGLRKPKNPVPGRTSPARSRPSARTCTELRPGDEVFGWCAAPSPSTRRPEDQFIAKPANLTFEEAAAVGVSATTALQLLATTARSSRGRRS